MKFVCDWNWTTTSKKEEQNNMIKEKKENVTFVPKEWQQKRCSQCNEFVCGDDVEEICRRCWESHSDENHQENQNSNFVQILN